MTADEIKQLWRIIETIERNGGIVDDFDIEWQQDGGIVGQLNQMMGGDSTTAHFHLDIVVPHPDEWDDPPIADGGQGGSENTMEPLPETMHGTDAVRVGGCNE